MTKLSPTAEAIWEAFNEEEAGVFVDYGDKLAAALRAAAKELRKVYANEEYIDQPDDWLDCIAAELEHSACG